jgi:MFS family permease
LIKKSFPIIALAIFSTMLGMGILAPVMPLFVTDLGASGIWLGLIGGGYHISRAILMPFIGRWSDRTGRKIFLGTGLFLYAGISLLYIFAENLPWLLGVRLLHGVVNGMIIPIARAWVGDITPVGEEGRWQGYFNTAFFSGAAAGPILGGILMDAFNTDVAFAAMGIFNFIAFLAVAFFLHEVIKPKNAQKPPASYKELVRNPFFWGLFLQRTGLELGYATFIFFLPIFAFNKLEMSPAFIGLLIGVTLMVTSWLQLLTGRLADHYDQRKLIIIGSVISFTVIGIIFYSPNVTVFALLLFIRSLGGALSIPSSAALTIRLGRRFGMGSVISLLGLATSVGMGIGPILAGPVYDFMGGISSVFYYAAGIGFIGLVAFVILCRKNDLQDDSISKADISSKNTA